MKHRHQNRISTKLTLTVLALTAATALTSGSTLALVQQRRDAEALAEKYKRQLIEATDLNKEYEEKIKELQRRLDATEVPTPDPSAPMPESSIVATYCYLDVPLSKDLQDHIYLLCCTYNIEDVYELIYAMIKQESRFDASAISSTNDYGLMQINIGNHAWLSSELGIVDFLDPYENVHAGIYMISSLIHKYDYNLADALMAYNMGEGNARPLWRRGVHTTSYTELVLGYYKQFIENI